MLKLLHELKGYQTNLGYSIGQILGYINLSPISQLDDGETEGVWEKLLQILIDEPDFEWLMIDASHIKEHPHAVGARGDNQDMARTKGGSTPRYTWPWMRMVCRSECLSQKVPELIAVRLSTLSKV